MKKLFFALITATALLSFASCGNSVEDKAKEYAEKMLNANTISEFEAAAAESAKWYNGLSEDDKKVANEAVKSYESKINAMTFTE